jgi:Reverse transcriptase (RNA-dependent DNA polymerase)
LDVQACLADRRRYERQIERLHERYLATSRLYELRQDDVSLATIVLNRGKVARLLARAVERGEYELEPGELKTIRAKDKLREVFSCRLTDLIVHGVVADIVQEATLPQLSSRVFSYRKGLGWLKPVSELAAYLRAEAKRASDPRERGVYVLRRDVDSYTDSIPIGPRSRLFELLEDALGGPLPSLVEQVVRVELRLPGGAIVCRVAGLPMGQPIAAVVANLYLSDLDRALEEIPGGFYARYADDFLFAHPDADAAREANARTDAVLAALSLTTNETKKRTHYLNPAGRPSDRWPESTGSSSVPFLGTRIAADGTVGLERRKTRAFLRELEQRTAATARTLTHVDRDSIGRAICAVVNRSLDPRSALTQQRSAVLLRRVVTDRQQLEQLDYWIARMVVRAVTGRRDVRTFREIPYAKLRRDWGLMSLVAARNAWPRSA